MPLINIMSQTLAGLARVAEREGVEPDVLMDRWLNERLQDEMRRRLLEAAGANKPDPMVLVDTPCAVTAFDMRAQISSDGRARGLWICLQDKSAGRMRQRKALMELEKQGLRRDDGSVNEAALLEWPAAKTFHAAMGRALRNRR